MTRRLLLLFLAAGALCAEDTWKGVERIVAIGDVHGGYAAFADILRNTGLTDERDRWIGGKAHLVQVGDVMDRGPDSRKIMELLMALERPAIAAGGRVHALIGNHEAMNMFGDLRYAIPEEFAAFAADESAAQVDAFYNRETRRMRPKPDAAFRAKWITLHPPGWVEHRRQYSPEGRYGKWIRSHNTIVKINDTLFVHAGISPKYASKSLSEINRAVADELSDFSLLNQDSVVRDEQGPLWYRGLASNDAGLSGHVKLILKNFGVKRIVIGHTPTGGRIFPFFGGAVVDIDAGLGQVYGEKRVCLVIEGDQAFAQDQKQKTPLP